MGPTSKTPSNFAFETLVVVGDLMMSQDSKW
jgi:hypothetical protein